MVKSNAGYTLLELTIVFAISGALIAIAFVGQAQLRSGAQFTGALDSVVTTLAATRNNALSGVETAGKVCGGKGTIVYFGGSIYRIGYGGTDKAGNPLPALINHQTLVVSSDGTTCSIETTLDTTIHVSLSEPLLLAKSKAFPTGLMIEFIRNPNGGDYQVCIEPYGTAVGVSFSTGTCQGPQIKTPTVLTFSDTAGRKSNLTIDPTTGLAKR
jgi:type II secretory pathway pseudopilin PulG